tara:strand:+ start:522 stop:818 length:297 start_codon:yes stop_codon:yes gene_type:complete
MKKAKSIKEQLQEGNIKFHVAGQTIYCKGEDGEYGMNPKTFRVSDSGESINTDYDGMNVTKWGPTCVTLYTFDILGKKSIGKIKYSDVTIVGEGTFID